MSIELERQLSEVQQELLDLKKEYTEFVYIASHDLSAPLRQIEGFSELIQHKNNSELDEKSQRYLQFIADGTNNAKNIIEALATYSKINTLSSPFNIVDMNELLVKIIDELTLELTFTGDICYHNLPTIVGDHRQISQVFSALIHNAIHYQNPDTPAKIEIKAFSDEKNWTFSITDNGIGIPAKLHDKVFKILRRGVSSKQYSGMGMGLAISRSIIQRHGGKIWLENNPIGTTINFTIAKHLCND